VGRERLGIFPAWAAVSPPRCVPPSPRELVRSGTRADGTPIYERIDSPARRQCRMLRHEVVDRILGDRLDLCALLGLNDKMKDTFFTDTMLPQGTEDQVVGANYLFNEGCRPHDCGVKGFVMIDTSGTHGVIGLLSCQRPRDQMGPELRTIYIASDFPSLEAMPESVRRRIEAWRERVEREENAACRCGERIIVKFLRPTD